MDARTQQNNAYINQIRATASDVLNAGDKATAQNSQWNSYFGGVAQLINGTNTNGVIVDNDFSGQNQGLVKDDVSNANNVLVQLNTWLDEPGYSRRTYLQKVRFVS